MTQEVSANYPTGLVELRLDLFPARVVIAPGTDGEATHEVARLLVGLDEIWAWVTENGVPILVFNDRYETIDGRRTTGWSATLSDGSELHFQRASGCGCGNILRGWRPPFVTSQTAALR